MIAHELLTAYADIRRDAWRRNEFQHATACEAVGKARAQVQAAPSRYARIVTITAPTYHNESFSDGLRYFECPRASGFREVGKASDFYRDACAWYADASQGSTIAGVVFQLPARNGQVQLFAGYRDSDDYGVVIRLRPVDVINSRGGEPDKSDYRDAASYADGLAKDAAESQRDHDAAWQAGSRYRDNCERIRENGKKLRELRRELRNLPNGVSDTVRGLVLAAIEDERQRIRETLTENAELKNGDALLWYFNDRDNELRVSFNDGAERAVLR